jgi:hypothetical protein
MVIDREGIMRMRRSLSVLIAAAGAAALAMALSAAAVMAATTGWNISPGGSFTGKQSGKVTIADTVTGESVVCTTTAVGGRLKSGTGLSGAGIGSIRSLSLTGCATTGGQAFTVTAGGLPWSLNADKYLQAKATTDGTLHRMHFTLAATGCSATIDGTGATSDNGSVVIHIHNSPSKLKFEAAGATLHVYVSSGCTGVFANGDAVTVDNAYLVSPAQTVIGPS